MLYLELFLYAKEKKKSRFGQLSMYKCDTLLMLYQTMHFLAVRIIEVSDKRDSN